MTKSTITLIVVALILFSVAGFTLGYNVAMNKAERITSACFAGDDGACNWWQAKFQESAAKQALREIEKSLTPQPTEVQ
ncbi:MAG: hypothetical protein UT13_C0001G0776 [Candidatus Pacebacteria bacterium GW2011_GWF2_38_9]|nr:MAG: hypothetical protein US01_C0001G0812 [candidate division TM6 bacterium GW2011_GWF2_28_16]KKQ08841.1 MAG: hypothetical protein US20_C0011G0010 [Candidatus Pacebacteria bacterium GW2011_GWF1_36_5]KKQ89128.1 MAG: hypothetical protein UT13_C0001G0776 [Candidatus Pacebacteria bacterium GW2011_GWF2_38_9]HAZ73628.1 hypothetical protein [Candidatus Paceibacterota bacterium]